MSMTGATSLEDLLDATLRRVYDLEQALTDPALVNDNHFDTIVLGPGGGQQIIMQVPTSVPTSIVVTPGAFQTNVFLDFTWTAPVDGSAAAYEVQLAKKVSAGVYQVETAQRVNATTVRFNNLIPQQAYGWRISAINNVGVPSVWTPASGYSDVTTGQDATLPAQVTGVAAIAIPKGFVVRWNTVADLDVVNGGMYRCEVATDSGFTAIVKTNTTAGQVTVVSDLTSKTAYYIRVTAIDASGNAGTPSSTVSSTSSSIDGVADVTANTITAASVLAGSITGDRITANSVDCNVLTSSSITSQTITISGSGNLKIGSPPGGTGLTMDASGIRLYNAGTITVNLNATTGSASFTGTITATGGSLGSLTVTGTLTGGTISGTAINGATITGGTIRTAASGNRVEMTSSSAARVSFFTGAAAEIFYGSIFVGTVGSGGGTQGDILITSPDLGSGSCSIQLNSRSQDNSSFVSLVQISAEEIRLYQSGGTGTVLKIGGGVATVTTNLDCNGLIRAQAVSGAGECFQAGNDSSIYDINIAATMGFKSQGGGVWAALNAAAFNVQSSIEFKKRVKPTAHGLSTIMALRAVDFAYKNPLEHQQATGLIAEEVELIFPYVVQKDNDGKPIAIDYSKFAPVLVKAIQELKIELDKLKESKVLA